MVEETELLRQVITKILLTPRVRYGTTGNMTFRRYRITSEFIPEIVTAILAYIQDVESERRASV